MGEASHYPLRGREVNEILQNVKTTTKRDFAGVSLTKLEGTIFTV